MMRVEEITTLNSPENIEDLVENSSLEPSDIREEIQLIACQVQRCHDLSFSPLFSPSQNKQHITILSLSFISLPLGECFCYKIMGCAGKVARHTENPLCDVSGKHVDVGSAVCGASTKLGAKSATLGTN